ncbi:MAG: hypothetical protein KJO25_02735, partial [Bacteroidia bacterium]|nr:hypothetical protein [Bacteroidia bacterium]
MRKFFTILLFSLMLMQWSCEKPFDPFVIGPKNIGYLTDSTRVKELPEVFINDSVASYIGGDEFTGNINNIEVY